jgi:hypothetical protein
MLIILQEYVCQNVRLTKVYMLIQNFMYVLILVLEDFLEVKLIKLVYKLVNSIIGEIQLQPFVSKFVLIKYILTEKM